MAASRTATAESISPYGNHCAEPLGGFPLRTVLSRRAPLAAFRGALRERPRHTTGVAVALYRSVRGRDATAALPAAGKRLAAESAGGRCGAGEQAFLSELRSGNP